MLGLLPQLGAIRAAIKQALVEAEREDHHEEQQHRQAEQAQRARKTVEQAAQEKTRLAARAVVPVGFASIPEEVVRLILAGETDPNATAAATADRSPARLLCDRGSACETQAPKRGRFQIC